MKIISKIIILTTMLGMTSCIHHNYTRIEPESLIDFSTEQVSFSLSSPSIQEDIANWLVHDKPTTVELGCSVNNKACSNIVKTLNLHNINYKLTDINNNVTLIYNKTLARDCNRVSRDKNGNLIRAHNLGCAVSANIVQMVSDHKQFIESSVLDSQDATKSVHHYNNNLFNNNN